ncbi:MAG: LptF/LptG family permease [Rhodobacteraceae bacterium]|nr:LptF/LptG family permease [Paracoccaceae bacterium]
MARYDRYVLSQLMLSFGFFALVLIAVYWVNRATGIFDSLAASGHTLRAFATYMALFLPQVVAITLPVSALVASVIVTRRLAEDRELVVLQTAGTGPFRLARPYVMFGLVVALLAGLLAHVFVPQSRAQLLELERELAADTAVRLIQPGRFVHPAPGVSLFVRGVEESGALTQLFLHDGRDEDSPGTYVARRAVLVADGVQARLIMSDGVLMTLMQPGTRMRTVHFNEASLDLSAFLPPPAPRRATPRDYPTLATLFPDDEMLATTGLDRAVFLFEAHDRLVQPILPLVLPVLSFAILLAGGFSRTGLWRPVALVTVAAVLIVLAGNAARTAAIRDLSLWPLLYAPGLAAGLLAAGLLLRESLPRRAAIWRGFSAGAGAR